MKTDEFSGGKFDAQPLGDPQDAIVPPGGDMPLDLPALDGGRRDVSELRRHGANTAEFLKDASQGAASGSVRYAHLIRTYDVRQSHSLCGSYFRKLPGMGAEEILEALRRLRVPHERVAAAIGRDRTVATKMLAGGRRVALTELEPLRALLALYETEHIGNTPDLPEVDPVGDYVEIEVLPTFAGMGGGGTGDADREVALIARQLVYGELRAKELDLLLINVRGNSMEPMFFHGDQLLVDRRDRTPTQPGPFALRYEDGYVVKNVTWAEKRTKLRLTSTNPEFGPEDWDPEDVEIIGRPVWCARRL